MLKVRPGLVVLLSLLVAGMAAACGGTDDGGDATGAAAPTATLEQTVQVEDAADATMSEDGSVIRVADTSSEFEWITNPLFEFIVEEGYGYTVELVKMTMPEAQEALLVGDVDLLLAARTPETADWFDGAIAGGEVVTLGVTYETDGFAVEKAAHKSLEGRYPDVVKMLKRMDVRRDLMEEVVEWADYNSVDDGMHAAAYYMREFNFQDRWQSWIPFKTYKITRTAMENAFPEFRTCHDCPEAEPTPEG